MLGAWITLQVSASKLIEYFILPCPIDVVPTLSDCLLDYIHSLIQKRHNSSALAMESCLFCIKLLICTCCFIILTMFFSDDFFISKNYLSNQFYDGNRVPNATALACIMWIPCRISSIFNQAVFRETAMFSHQKANKQPMKTVISWRLVDYRDRSKA